MTSLQQTAMLGGAASAKTASYTLVAADAGTAISMNSASATTITVNTALFAAGDTVQITNLGAGVCTVTAGTATVNTSASLALAQYESGTLDFTSTSAAIFIKGAGASAASGGMTLINSGGTALSGSSVTISSIPTTYVNLFISWVNVTGSAIADFRIRFNGITTANSHMQARVRNRDGVLSGGLGNDDSFATLGFICATSAFMSSGRGNLIVNNASIAQIQSMPYIHYASDDDAAAGRACFQGIAGFTPGAAITSVTFLPSGGTFSTGTVYVYGVN
jgi:hypothetical protein